MGQIFPVKSSLSYKGAGWEYPLLIFLLLFSLPAKYCTVLGSAEA